ncbi:hypothetical protein GGX14DRAFT_397879 [Mycena pura]|uniref:F-box domain-containing protein n=1 Tax=Mycena pura TaxID=153505 RepID=A0AAD6VBE2_9AGAR|nr:hypothetical protein GGX14DRAFT_397879 [Mycena pura]
MSRPLFPTPAQYSPSPRIPQELCEKVLACLTVKYDPALDVDDQDRYFTLRQCALVCKDWLPSARSHIFREVDLSSRGAESLLQLVDLNPMLTRYMTRVIVRCTIVDDFALEALAQLAPKLMAVRHLSVLGRWGDSSYYSSSLWRSEVEEEIQGLHDSIFPLLQAPTLTDILLKGFTFTSGLQLNQFICNPSLITLILSDIYVLMNDKDRVDDVVVQDTSPRCTISELGLACPDPGFGRWVLHPGFPVNIASIRDLGIRLEDAGDMHRFLPLLNAIGTSLKVFSVFLPDRCDLRGHPRFASIVDAIPILPNTHIEEILVSGFDRRDPSIGVYNMRFDGAEYVKSLLSRLPVPQRLKTVTIYEDVEIIWRKEKEFPRLKWENWQMVDECLAQDTFSNVKQLEFFAGLKNLGVECDLARKGTVFDLTVDYTNTAWVMFNSAFIQLNAQSTITKGRKYYHMNDLNYSRILLLFFGICPSYPWTRRLGYRNLQGDGRAKWDGAQQHGDAHGSTRERCNPRGIVAHVILPRIYGAIYHRLRQGTEKT